MVRHYLEKLPKNVEEAAEWYMRYISPLTLVVALIVDTFFLLRRVDTLLTSLILFFYLSLAAFIIVLISLIQTGRSQHWWLIKIMPLLPVVSQYAFGGLFIAFLSLYSRSAAATVTWVFVVGLVILLIANERFVRFYLRFPFQVSILFMTLFSFLIFYVPLVFGSIGPVMFLTSGVASLIVIAAFLRLQAYLTPELVQEHLRTITRSIIAIFVVFNVLYFSNAIPPLPLALKEAGVYHGVERVGEEYHLVAESRPWYREYFGGSVEFHRVTEEPAYVYTAIFAPTGLSTVVSHEWQRYDERLGTWVTEEVTPFSIVGGREGGFRGYTIKAVDEGKWRVNVTTTFGQLIGRVSFRVINVNTPNARETIVR